MVSIYTTEKALKSYYLDVLTKQINDEANPLLARIRQTTENVWGKDVKRIVQYGVNGGIGAGSETGNLPTASGNAYEQFTLSLKNLYGKIEISDKAVRASENNAGAFVNLLNAEMEGLVKSATFNMGRMLYGDGTGTLCKVVSVSGNICTVDSVKNLVEGLLVDFVPSGSYQPLAGYTARKITAVDRTNKTVTISGAVLSPTDITANTSVTVQGSLNQEITGLGAIFKSTGTIYGLSRSSHKWLIPYMQSSVGDITEAVIQKAIDTLEEQTGSRVNFIVCSSGVKRAFMNYLSTYRRNTDFMDLNGGYKAISFNGIPIVSDRFCPDGTMYLLNTDDFTMHQLCDWQWLEGEDGKVLKQISGTPTYSATLVKYADIICARPCGQAMLTGITEA